MKLGVFGGTFDPVHVGHLLLAEACRDALSLAEVRWIPAREPPHKPGAVITAGKQRVEMLEFATAGYPEFVIDSRELKRPGPSFTVDTLRELQQEFPEAELFLLIGADSVHELQTWKLPAEIAALATIVGVNRRGVPAVNPQALTGQLPAEVLSRLVAVEMPGVDISASDLRDRVRHGRSIRYQVPRAVEMYVREHRLYDLLVGDV